MFEAYEQTFEFALIEEIAARLREELGVAIEEQPGHRDPSGARQVNRAFRLTVRCLLRTLLLPENDLPAQLSWVLGRVARRRLEGGGVDSREVEHLLVLEYNGRDDWIVFLILTDWQEIEFLLETRGPDRDPSEPTPVAADPILHFTPLEPDPMTPRRTHHDAR